MSRRTKIANMDITYKAHMSVRDKRQMLMSSLHENDTEEMLNVAENFGPNQEYFCIYAQKYYYDPWWFNQIIEFRPFRNIRTYTRVGGLEPTKIGYYKNWVGQPQFTHQIYHNGRACNNSEKNSTAFVTYLCGTDNRIVDFKIIKICDYFELLFETPLACSPVGDRKFNNQLAIDLHGEIKWTYMYIYGIVMVAFILLSLFILVIKKSRLY